MGTEEHAWCSGSGRPVPKEVVVMMFGYGNNWAFWQLALMWIGMIAFWGILIWGLYALITGTTRRPDQVHHGEDGRRILDQRLAKGEIDTEEYRRLRDLIADSDRTPVGAGDRR
jgi:putative membrane protein